MMTSSLQRRFCYGYVRIKTSLLVAFILLQIFAIIIEADADCKLVAGKDDDPLMMKQKQLLKRLDPLKGQVLSVARKENTAAYKYTVGICTSISKNDSSVGATQDDQSKKEGSLHILGRFNATQVFSGNNWIMLIYSDGEKYKTLCGEQERETKIMVTCDPNNLISAFQMLEERRIMGDDNFCHYLFELGSYVACTAEAPTGLSSGSVFCIIFITFAGIYLLLGFLYRRIVVGAKGMEQIPNYSFWKDFGSLQADGCDFLCRCGPRHDVQAYRGIDDPLEREVDKDDQLLPM